MDTPKLYLGYWYVDGAQKELYYIEYFDRVYIFIQCLLKETNNNVVLIDSKSG